MQLRDKLSAIWGGLSFALKLIVVFNLVWLFLNVLGILLVIQIRSPTTEPATVVTATSAILQFATSLILAILYGQQKNIDKVNITPDVRVASFGISDSMRVPLKLMLENVGEGTASDIEIKLEAIPLHDTRYQFVESTVGAIKVVDEFEDNLFAGQTNYLSPKETAKFQSNPRFVYIDRYSGPKRYGKFKKRPDTPDGLPRNYSGMFYFGTSTKSLEKMGINEIRVKLSVQYMGPQSEQDNELFFDRVIPLVRFGGFEFAIKNSVGNRQYEIHSSNDDDYDISNIIFTDDDVGKTVLDEQLNFFGMVESIYRGRGVVWTSPNGERKTIQSEDVVIFRENEIELERDEYSMAELSG